MYISWTFTHPRVVERWAGLTLAPVLTGHTVTVHLGTVLPLVALRTATVVVSIVVQTGRSVSTRVLQTLIVILPAVGTYISKVKLIT